MKYDLALIGGGFSAYSLIDALAFIRLDDLRGKSIVVFNVGFPLMTGIAYNIDLPTDLLLQNQIAHNAYTDEFMQWLTEKSEQHYRITDHVPRNLFGRFLGAKFGRAVHLLGQNGVRVDVVHSAVQKVVRSDEQIDLYCDGQVACSAKAVVVATGILTRPPIANSAVIAVDGDIQNYSKITQLRDTGSTVAIIGSGPSGFDVLRLLEGSSCKVSIYDPHEMIDSTKPTKACSRDEFVQCSEYKNRSDITADGVYECLRSDVGSLKVGGCSTYDLFSPFHEWLDYFYAQMDSEQKTKLLREHSDDFMRLMARNIPNNEAILNRIHSGTITHIQRKADVDASGLIVNDIEYDAVIRAHWPRDDIRTTSDPLIASLCEFGLQPSHNDRGFLVDDSFLAGDGIYVLGPLLAGNTLHDSPVFGAESTARIAGYARELAANLEFCDK